MSNNTIDFEVYDIRNLSAWGKITEVDIRIYGNVNEVDIDYKTTCWIPTSINTYNEVATHLAIYILSPVLYKPIEPEITECPNDGTPLQNGECMVCGFKAVI